ncbi:MAG: CHAT domain-containing protein, partial [Planctomycetales bacterium]|nr:CHAT domain-containing protein [Planctomycetales bacterium]
KHPDYANSLSNLGLLYDNMADYARAEPLYRQSLEIRKEVLGEKHPDYAGGLNNLALLYYHMDDFASAEPLYRQSLEILKPVFGEMHPNYSKAHYSLAYLYHRTGDYERAEQFYSRAAAMSRMQLENSALIQSERQQLAMGLMVRYQLDNYISLSLASEDYAGPLFGEVLAWKGATLVRQRGMRLAASDPRIADRFLQLQQVARQLGALAQTVPVQLDQQESWRERVRELTNQKERLEAELSRKSAAFRAAEQEITFAQLLSALPKDAVLVDYLEYGKESRKLIAFVVRHAENEGDRVTLFNLGPVAPISEAIITWRQTFGMSPESNRAGATLRSAIWEPLVAAIGDAKTVLVSTDGVLGRLPLGALPGREPAHYLLEDHRLAYVPVPRLIPELSANRDGEEAPGRLLLVGDVDYGLNAAGQPYPWTRLPGTADEIDSLQSLKGSGNQTATALRGQEASEERIVEELSKCSVGHFATHGLFESRLECVLPMFSPLSRGATSGDSLLTLKSGEERPQTITVTRSGLVLAGANSPLKTTADQSDGESATDGLLMADEILTMPLQNTDLIVLSACDTAQGDARGGEGLLGIQRAFQVAGVRTTVASYWKVDDLATQLLMERFHQNLAQPATTPLDALRDAQLWMLRSGKGALRDSAARAITKGDSRGAKLPPELDQFAGDRLPPFYWAAFSLSGDWR